MTLAKDVKHGTVIKKIYKIDDVKPLGDIADENGPITFTITTDVRDRDHDIVDPAGVMVENFTTNPVMQWAHNYDEMPVGKSVSLVATKIKAVKDGNIVEQNAIQAKVVFQPDSNYHESYAGIRGSMIRRMYLTGFLNAVSIGFDPMEWEDIEEKDDGKSIIIAFNDGTRFTKWDLLEFSAVPVPANPQALMDRAKSFGYDDARVKSMLNAWTPEAIKFCAGDDCPLKELKGVIPYKKTGQEDPDASWSGPAEVAAADTNDLGIICTWKADKPAAELVKGDFKLPHHTAKGHLLVKAGLVGCGNAIQGARGGVNIPAAEIPGVKSHLQKHYHEFDMTAPWEPKAEASMNGFEHLKNKIVEIATAKAGADRVLSPADEKALASANDMLDKAGDIIEKVLTSVTGTDYNDSYTPPIEAMFKVAELEATIKEGRVLSQANEGDLRDAVTAHNSGVKLTNGVLNQVTGKPGPSPPAAPKPQGDNPSPSPSAGDATPASGTNAVTPLLDMQYPLGSEATTLKESVAAEIENAQETGEVVESDDDIIIVDEDDLLAVINGITDDEPLSLTEQRETDETTTEA
jgi:hypothetical protein